MKKIVLAMVISSLFTLTACSTTAPKNTPLSQDEIKSLQSVNSLKKF